MESLPACITRDEAGEGSGVGVRRRTSDVRPQTPRFGIQHSSAVQHSSWGDGCLGLPGKGEAATPPDLLFLRHFFFSARGGLTSISAHGFLLCRQLRRFSPFPLLIPTIMKLLIRRLFLHASIMSQIPRFHGGSGLVRNLNLTRGNPEEPAFLRAGRGISPCTQFLSGRSFAPHEQRLRSEPALSLTKG